MPDTTPSKTVLLVDDEEHLLITLRDFLAHHGFDVVLARRAEEALQKLRSMTPDLVILDISMPGLGGVGFLRSVMPDGNKPPWPILVLTARANLKDFFDDIPIAGFVAKPCRKDSLLATIREIVNADEPGSAQTPRRSGSRMLILGEDDPTMAEILASAFRNAAYEVILCPSGPEVLEKATQIRPDILAIKRMFTKMNGETVASLLRSMTGTQAIPIVVYDTEDDLAGRERILRYADVFVPSTHAPDLLEAAAKLLKDDGVKVNS
jgi:DNA-binding response OmpR family regulator